MRTGVLRVALAALLLAGAERGEASPGNGIRLGGSAGRLHPYLELEGRYDSNIAYTEPGKSVGAFIIHVRPGLTLDSPGEQVAVDLKANLDWEQVLGSQSGLSRLYGQAELGVGFNRRGELGLEFSDVFSRSASTQAMSLGTAVISNSNELSVKVPYRPGGGALVTTAYGDWQLATYEPFDKTQLCAAGTPSCDTSQLAKLGYSSITAGVDSRWKFLPRTAAVLQGEYFVHQPQDTQYGDNGSGIRLWTGVAGLFGAHLAGTVKGGYGDTFGTFGVTFRTWLANVEAEWLPVETTGLKGGYVHDYDADAGKSFLYSSHRVYVEAHTLLEGRYTARLNGSWEHRIYEQRSGTSADLLTFEPVAEAELARWLHAGLGYVFTKRTSKFPAGTPALPGYAFDKHEVYLQLRGTY
jgi:Putative beta-barrel porin 2